MTSILKTPRVFDCFPFNRELDLAELRIQELWDVVDFFVIAEATSTHQNKPKELNIRNNWDRFEKYKSKIRYIVVEDMPNDVNDTWVNERFQRHALTRGLYDLDPSDIVITSDCDEIARADIIQSIKDDPENFERYQLFVPMCYFKFNYIMTVPYMTHGMIMVTKGRAYQNPNFERGAASPWGPKVPSLKQIRHGGWHFSYLGDTKAAIAKIQSFAHQETNVPSIVNTLDVEYMVANRVGLLGNSEGSERFEHVKMDEYFPKTVLNDLEKYKDYIIFDAEKTMYDVYPRHL